ncbi:MAG: flagellar export chaperone FliS [Sideroxyarcus sp.]|nr:flagellar export chaperone FliS [Sideroxyarcus sp.]
MNTAAAIKAYANTDLESSVLAADPHKLIALLYQGALLAIANARNAMLRKDIPAKGKAISHAMAIIDEGLKASLDKNVGGDLVHNLEALYDYMCARLLAANVNNDVEALDEVARLLGEIKGAWDSIRETALKQQMPVAPPQPVPMNKQPALVYGRR